MSRVVTFGEIMLRLATPGHLRFAQADVLEATYGGGEANVAVSLAQLGLEVDYVTRLPQNELGDAALMALRRYGVGTRHVLRGGDRIGIYFLETGAASRGSKVLYDRAGSALATLEPGMVPWSEVFRGAAWFHWTGITPAVSAGAAAVCAEAIAAARAAGLTVSADLNYRKKLWRWGRSAGEVMSELLPECDLILANEEDAAQVFGIHAPGIDVVSGRIDAQAFRTVAEALMARFPRCRKVIVTLRGSVSASHNTWSGVLWDGTRLLTTRSYDIVPIVDRVGGGDAFMAGIIYGGIRWPEDDQRTLDFAVAASCLKHSVVGDFNLVSVAEVEKLMGGDASGRVSR